MQQKKILISGANGFLGRAVTARLPANWLPFALVRGGTTARSGAYSKVFDSSDSLETDGAQFDTVFHLAAAIPADYDLPDAGLLTTNVDLVSRLIRLYPNARHVYASSVAIYGIPVSLPLSVESAMRCPTRYGLSKLAGECIARQASSHAVIRYSSLIGRGMKTNSFIPVAVEGARRGQISLRGDVSRLQNYLHINDAADMCIRSANTKDSSVRLGIGRRSHSNLEVAEILASHTGASIVKEGTDTSPSFVYSQYDAAELDAEPRSLDEILTEMLDA